MGTTVDALAGKLRALGVGGWYPAISSSFGALLIIIEKGAGFRGSTPRALVFDKSCGFTGSLSYVAGRYSGLLYTAPVSSAIGSFVSGFTTARFGRAIGF
jgi:hypothetical protein